MLTSQSGWSGSAYGWDEGTYRVREVNGSYYNGSIVHDREDADRPQDEDPVAKFGTNLYEVSYDTQDQGAVVNVVITNKSTGPFSVRKVISPNSGI